MNRILYIVNPAGHGGAGGKVWDRMQSEWPDQIDPQDVRFTQRQGHDKEIAACAEGYDILAAVGGDGTVGEIMSGMMAQSGPRPKLAITPAGTGNDIGRNVGVYSFEDAINALRGGRARKFDLIRIDCQVDGRKAYRYAFLSGSVGFSVCYMARPWMKRYLGPKGAYYLSIVLGIIAFRIPHMTVRWQGHEYGGRTWVVYAANVERTAGGSMCIAPGARPDDGKLHVAIVPSRSKLYSMTKMMPKVPSGAHVREPGVSYFSTEKLDVECERPGIVEIDGDVFGTAPATFTVCSKAIEVIRPVKTDEGGV